MLDASLATRGVDDDPVSVVDHDVARLAPLALRSWWWLRLARHNQGGLFRVPPSCGVDDDLLSVLDRELGEPGPPGAVVAQAAQA